LKWGREKKEQVTLANGADHPGKKQHTLNSVSAGLVVGNSLASDGVDTKGFLLGSTELN